MKALRMNVSAGLLGVTLLLTSGSVVAAPGDVTEITITTVDHSFSAPAQVPAGLVAVTIKNEGHEPHHVQLVRLKDGVTPDQFGQTMQEDFEKALEMVNWVGGPSIVDHGGASTVTLDLDPGTHMLLCFVPNPQGVPHVALGIVGVMQVVPSDEDEATEPEANLTVDLLDFSYAFSESIEAGKQTWEVVNDGKEIHEISLIRVNDDKTMEDVEHFMHAMQGPPPFAFAGGMQAIDPGSSGWLHLDLTPGNYVAICHIPDAKSGQTHAMLGMVMPFVVE